MKNVETKSDRRKWAWVIALTVLHPILLLLLAPYVGERANLIVAAAPFTAAWLLNRRIAVAVMLVNAVSTATVFSVLFGDRFRSGFPKSLISIIVVVTLLFGIDRWRRYVDKGKAMTDEIARIRGARRY